VTLDEAATQIAGFPTRVRFVELEGAVGELTFDGYGWLIKLAPGRSTEDTVATLCHELAHAVWKHVPKKRPKPAVITPEVQARRDELAPVNLRFFDDCVAKIVEQNIADMESEAVRLTPWLQGLLRRWRVDLAAMITEAQT